MITAWEVFEHIAANKLSEVMGNVRRHLAHNGMVVASISPHPATHHQTVKPKAWWINRFAELGFVHCPDLETFFGTDLVRGWEGYSFPIVLRQE